MTVVTGTATDHVDFYTKLKSFLTSGIGGGQNWTQAWAATGGDPYPTDVVMRGPGLSGGDEIYVGMRLHEDIIGDSYWVEFHGMTGALPLSAQVSTHVNNHLRPALMFLNDSPMTYWFIGNGRRFVVIVKISTVFESAYCGFILPFGTPSEYPYPLFIGAMAGPPTNSPRSPESWRDNIDGHTSFLWPWAEQGIYIAYENAFICSPDGDWKILTNTGVARHGKIGPGYSGGSFLATNNDGFRFFPKTVYERMVSCYGGDNMLVRTPIFLTNDGDQTLGVLDGVYKCQGFSKSAEDLITVSGLDHMVVQNAFRTEFWDYFAVAMQ